MAESSTILLSFPIPLDKATTDVVLRPPRNEREEDEQEEVLVIEGIELKNDEFVKFDVFINDEDYVIGTGSGAEKTEFAGSFVKVPHKRRQEGGDHGGEKLTTTKLRLGIRELLEGLGEYFGEIGAKV